MSPLSLLDLPALRYVVLSVADAAITLALVLLAIRLLRITRLRTKIILLHLPLIKPFLVIFEAIPIVSPRIGGVFGVGVRIPDPAAIGPPVFDNPYPLPNYEILSSVTLGLLSALVGLLLFRRVALALYYRWIGRETLQSPHEAPELFEQLGTLVKTMGIPHPEVAVTDKTIPPMVIGVRRPTLILPASVLEEIEGEELRIMLAHELAHIKHRDNFWQWATVMLKDLQFFNPASRYCFNQIALAREMACDRMAAEKTGSSGHLAADRLLAAILAVLRQRSASAVPQPAHSFTSSRRQTEARVFALTSWPQGILASGRIGRRATLAAGAILVLILQITIVVGVAEVQVFLR